MATTGPGSTPAPAAPSPALTITATRVATGLARPDFVTAAPGDAGRLFIVGQYGQIQVLDLAHDQLQAQPFLDISGGVDATAEDGLLGMAFDPNYAQNGRFYVDFIDKQGNTEIRSYQVSATNPNLADPASGQTVMIIPQPEQANHKGGWIGFGPDGDLYVATGDGGGEGDPLGNGQNPATLLGKMLRIDVHHDGFPDDPYKNYAIPADNPFVGHQGVASEIWALGLRNPWRDSFDPATGKLIIADVGQDHWEEIDIGAPGANYGWNVYEGPAVFAGGTPSVGTLTAPIYSYPHPASGGAAIIGGAVYEGPGNALHGAYFFADYISGQVFTLEQTNGQWQATDRTAQIVTDAGHVTNPESFGTDAAGNLYLVDYGGDIWRLTPHTAAGTPADSAAAGGLGGALG